ncbi:ADP-ribose pyrophosphatase YjhB (NUDIX family) [Diaminobutyricimonas aerilata]|uniref:ADP-ribose pyrophosphatase YjhB (NUDIX family) n=1 Tax=Diaminobutyricimonas aerilata TaxID=1162967 RepID=A0A2M9CKK9_9MICO|nr:NUDIX domain-containing protein [Diaminobutyricimonas aerilata]PJJ72417.1 ADP-ribose pyrophosphatase YjhB (NUDIX family) [Diaminobutyricimonas aerilata]
MDAAPAPSPRRVPDPQRRPLGSGDEWVDGPRGRFWGGFGAAGLLVAHRAAGVLLQLRVGWSHFGGTWGLPGGARKEHEDAAAAALREAGEEAGVPAGLVRVVGESVLDYGYWSYTTVLGVVEEPFVPVIADAESDDLRWVPFAEVDALPLHPGFAASWPMLRPRIESLV